MVTNKTMQNGLNYPLMEYVFHINLVFAGSRHIYVPLWVLMEGWKIHNAGWSSSLGRHAVRVQWQVAIRGRCICWVIKGLFIWSRSVPWARYLEIFCKLLMFSYCRPGLLGFSKRSLGKIWEKYWPYEHFSQVTKINSFPQFLQQDGPAWHRLTLPIARFLKDQLALIQD